MKTRIQIGWDKFRQLASLRTNKDMSLIMRGRLYSSCVRSSMLHGSETCPVRKDNVGGTSASRDGMVRWMCGVKLKDRPLTCTMKAKSLRGGVGHQSCSCDLKLCSKLDSRHNTKLLAEIAKTEKRSWKKHQPKNRQQKIASGKKFDNEKNDGGR